MSGSSDYTRTPNYNFYLPAYDADIDAWGDHLNWNTTALDSTLHGLSVGQAGGPFLPLTGGILSGGLSVGSPGIRFPTMGSAAADFQWAYSASNIYAYINGTAQGPLLTQPQGDARWLQLSGNTGLINAANDAAAASAGVAVGGLYRNGSVVQIRVT